MRARLSSCLHTLLVCKPTSWSLAAIEATNLHLFSRRLQLRPQFGFRSHDFCAPSRAQREEQYALRGWPAARRSPATLGRATPTRRLACACAAAARRHATSGRVRGSRCKQLVCRQRRNRRRSLRAHETPPPPPTRLARVAPPAHSISKRRRRRRRASATSRCSCIVSVGRLAQQLGKKKTTTTKNWKSPQRGQ